jgi:hypothetical protein
LNGAHRAGLVPAFHGADMASSHDFRRVAKSLEERAKLAFRQIRI